MNGPAHPHGRTRWRPIATELGRAIRAGRYAPGDRLPSSAALQARHGVSGQTVQHAMNSLRVEGLVETRPGRGWFASRPPEPVRLHRPARPGRGRPGRPDHAHPGCPADEPAWRTVTVRRVEAVSARMAAELAVEPGTAVFVRERTVFDGPDVVALVRSTFPRRLSRGTAIETADTGPEGAFGCLVRLGYEVVAHVERVSVGVASAAEARRLARPDPPVVLRIVRVAAGRHCVFATMQIVALADRVELCYELPVASA